MRGSTGCKGCLLTWGKSAGDMLAENLPHREDAGPALLRSAGAPAGVAQRAGTRLEGFGEVAVRDDVAVADDHGVRLASPTQ